MFSYSCFSCVHCQQSVVPISQQISQFSVVKANLTALLSPGAAEAMLSKSLFFISIGSNDIFAYFASSSTMPKDQFIGLLISAYSDHITVTFLFITIIYNASSVAS